MYVMVVLEAWFLTLAWYIAGSYREDKDYISLSPLRGRSRVLAHTAVQTFCYVSFLFEFIC